jgi:BirA family biotin operon repressor/biotin-[acetyl-CoA-carboxylase] ligase
VPHRVVSFDTIGSTNDEAMSRLVGGDPGGLWVTARRQTGGRGRRGRIWVSPPGNLYASLALRLAIDPALAAQLGFVAGIALFSVLADRLDHDPRLRIKWPNDVIFGGAKLAGLLLECTMLGQGELGCVVGFGVNCRSHPEGLPYPATDLTAAGWPDAQPADLLDALSAAMDATLRVWDAGAGFAAIRLRWLSASIPLGTPLFVALPSQQLTGTFEGLDEQGRLRVGSGGTVMTVEAGDVFLPELATQS